MLRTINAVDVEVDRGVASVVINRPERRNALTQEARRRLTEIMLGLAGDDETQAVVLSSREGAFSAGQDLGEAKDFPVSYIPEWIDEHMRLYEALLSYPKPLIAAIDGCCVGAGLQVALMCDLRLATPGSFFAMPELDDAIPCVLGVWALWDVIGRGRTTEMVLTNRQVPATEALTWGLVNRVIEAPALAGAADELARSMASKSELALRLTKERLHLLTLAGTDSLRVHAQLAHAIAFSSGEPALAMEEFLSNGRGVS